MYKYFLGPRSVVWRYPVEYLCKEGSGNGQMLLPSWIFDLCSRSSKLIPPSHRKLCQIYTGRVAIAGAD